MMDADSKIGGVTLRVGKGDPDLIALTNVVAGVKQRVDVLFQDGVKERSLSEMLRRRALQETVEYMSGLSTLGGVMVPCNRFDNSPMWAKALEFVDIAPGDIAMEFGVYTGSSLKYWSDHLPCPIYGFDSFEGLPESDGIWREGRFYNPKGPDFTPPPHVELVKGWFNDTLPVFMRERFNPARQNIAFVHIDCDLYSSTVTVLQELGPHLKSGCVLLFDEYWNYPGWQRDGFKAWQEFIARTGLKYEYLAYADAAEQVAIRIL